VTRLSVNLNKVALLRNTRDLDLPSVTRIARICIEAGAQGITVHPRPDERHIRPSDVYELAAMLSVELNVEGNPFPEWLRIVREVRPAQATLVPDSPDARTSDHGYVLVRKGRLTEEARRVRDVIRELASLGIRTSLFMDADKAQIEAVPDLGAARIELYTEPYARAFGTPRQDEVWARYAAAAARAQALGLGVNAGHDLNLRNLAAFLRIPGILEVSIGHALTADALEMGFPAAVRAYLAITSGSAGAQ
jgi:pyridoxine 5-phosphate synthase